MFCVFRPQIISSKGKSCKFLMIRSSLIKLLETTPSSLSLCLMQSGDTSGDIILASGAVNDSKKWQRHLIANVRGRKDHVLIDDTYLIHLLKDGSNDVLGHVVIKIKLLVTEQSSPPVAALGSNTLSNSNNGSADDDNKVTNNKSIPGTAAEIDTNIDSKVNADIDSVTGQKLAAVGVKYYLPNTWFPPPLQFTATRSISNTSLSSIDSEGVPERAGEEIHEKGRKNKEMRHKREVMNPPFHPRDESLHWAALMEGNPNSFPWRNIGLRSPPLKQHTSPIRKIEATCASPSSPSTPISLEDRQFPVLSALCDEVMQLRQMLPRGEGAKETLSKAVQTETISPAASEEKKKTKERRRKKSRGEKDSYMKHDTISKRHSEREKKSQVMSSSKKKPIERVPSTTPSPLTLNASSMRDTHTRRNGSTINKDDDDLSLKSSSPPSQHSPSPPPSPHSESHNDIPTVTEPFPYPSPAIHISSSSSSSSSLLLQSKGKLDVSVLSKSTESLPIARAGGEVSKVKSFLSAGSNIGQRIYLATSLQSLGQMSTEQGEDDEEEEGSDEKGEQKEKTKEESLQEDNGEQTLPAADSINVRATESVSVSSNSITEEINEDSYNYTDDFESDRDED